MRKIIAIITLSLLHLSSVSQVREMTFYTNSLGMELRNSYQNDSILIQLCIRNFDDMPIAIPDSAWVIGEAYLLSDSTKKFLAVHAIANGAHKGNIRVRKLNPGEKFIYILKIPRLCEFVEVNFFYSNHPNYLIIFNDAASRILDAFGFYSGSTLATLRDFIP